MDKATFRGRAWVVALQYAVFGVLWILLTDWLLVEIVPEPDRLALFQTFKGLVFIALSVAVIFLLVRRENRRAEFAAAELARQRQRLTSIIEASGLGTWETDLVSGRVAVNDRFGEILGYPAGTLPSLTREKWAALIHEQDRPRAQRLLDNHLAGKIPYFDCDVRMLRRDGGWTWVQNTGRIIERDKDGRALQIFGTTATITHRKNLENRLRQTTRLLETAESIAGLGSWEYEPDAGTVIMSRQLREMLDCEPAYPFRLTTYLRCFHPTDRPELVEAARQLLKGQTPYLPEIRSNPANGPTRYYRAECRVVVDAQGRPTDYFGTLADITEHKKAMKDLSIAAVAFDVQEGIAILDHQGNIQRVNRAFTSITGYAREDVMGKPLRIYQSGIRNSNFFPALMDELRDANYWEGEIWQRRRNGERFPAWMIVSGVESEGGETGNYVCSFTDISERKLAELEIHRLAYFDPLTKLANRRLLFDHVGHALATSARSGEGAALVMIDLDRFKNLNDTYGHMAGDELLVKVANRLQERTRKTDTVARLGGDEFVVLLESLGTHLSTAARNAHTAAELIREALGQSYELESVKDFRLTASIGITLFQGDTSDFDELLKQADLALYEAKSRGRNRVCFFSEEMQRAVAFRTEIEAGLEKAREREELQLYYQPQVDNTGRTIGVEALLRWLREDRQWLSPADFIPVAEESGLIVPIGYWVLEEACRQLKQWQDQGRKIKMAVNISAIQFHDPDFVDGVREIIAGTGIAPADLQLELTETILLENVEAVVARMAQLREAGVGFSMDDFGTGYCSLIYLKRLPINQVKIDASFVRDVTHDPNDAEIVRTILAMSRTLGFDTIAEGVETEEQRQFLVDNGCEKHQGFLFAKPMPVEELNTHLAREAVETSR